MKKTIRWALAILLPVALIGLACKPKDEPKTTEKPARSVYDFEVNTIDGKKIKLDAYKGKVLLIVNVASKCGLTPQYEGLQALYSKYKYQDFEILGFPCNQFGGQEPGTSAEIKSFCSSKYSVDFPLFEKIKVNGDNTHPLYVYLKNEQTGSLGTKAIKWNFTKFLVDKNGKVVKRFSPKDSPESVEPSIAALLH